MTARSEPHRAWTVAEARESRRQPMGEWLVANVPRGANLEITGIRESRREVPFVPDRAGRLSTVEPSEEDDE